MTAVMTDESVLDRDELIALIALIACGVASYPGKTQACDVHRKKGEALLAIASRGAVDALAATICGAEKRGACVACEQKAVRILDAYNKGAE
ncbi:hypothetical protein ABZ804_21995 [Streptomyces sp. NPDC047726]|uniref:hypothetical protein n=1 Tax=unclassified Streptomyces TaxID=2593676 RepID=UPI0033F1A024